MFIQVIQGKVADAAGLQQAMDRWVEELQPAARGWLGSTGGITDDGTCVMVVRFESVEDARRNSERPEQGAWWAQAEACFDGAVTFFDCPDVTPWMGGGSDDAGFVQIIEGQTSDAERMQQMMDRYTEEMHTMRPEIIGGTIAVHDGGEFVETVYFTNEAEAREHETLAPPDEFAAAMAGGDSLMEIRAYLDLHDPWLVSPRG